MEEYTVKNFVMPGRIFKMCLTPYDIAVYSYIIYCSDSSTHIANVKMTTITNTLSISLPTVRKSIYRLNDMKLIRIEQKTYLTPSGEIRRRCNKYHILSHPFRRQKNMIE